ncbi:MAG: hypothetical protein U0903_02250 [Planctomycetales bacterium]
MDKDIRAWDFEGDESIEIGIAGEEDDAMASHPESAEDFKAPKAGVMDSEEGLKVRGDFELEIIAVRFLLRVEASCQCRVGASLERGFGRIEQRKVVTGMRKDLAFSGVEFPDFLGIESGLPLGVEGVLDFEEQSAEPVRRLGEEVEIILDLAVDHDVGSGEPAI